MTDLRFMTGLAPMTPLPGGSQTLGLYLHSPFCGSKCGYCDFNSWAERESEPMRRWHEAMLRQFEFWTQHTRSAPRELIAVDTLFWGGGTPTLLPLAVIQDILEKLPTYFSISTSYEFTIEANPETISKELLQTLWACGVNRLSLGIQSFQDRYLDRLERNARRATNLHALDLIATHWPGRWSMDLIYGLPEQDESAWQLDLMEAMRFGPRHLSTYELTLSTARSRNWKKPGEELILRLGNLTEAVVESEGLCQYEISNYAQPGQESRHNLRYWNMESFLGLGPGAAGFLSAELSALIIPQKEFPFGCHQKQPAHFEKWCEVAGTSREWNVMQARSNVEDVEEKLMMGLRLCEGIPISRFGSEWKRLEPIVRDYASLGMLSLDDHRLRATRRGQVILDTVLGQIFSRLQ